MSNAADMGSPDPSGVGAAGVGAVGVIGLGAMGAPMAENLLAKSGLTVKIAGRTKDKHAGLLAAGAQWCSSPRELAESCDRVLLMLPDLPEVESVLAGEAGLLAAGSDDLLLIISSTSSPTGVRELADRLAGQTAGAVRVVDAPVSGGVDGATAGTLSIMVGGADSDVARALPVLEACGTPVHLGPLGAGEVAKACNQLIVSATILALGEAAVLADRSGLDLAKMFDLLAGGYANSRILETRGTRIVTEDYSPSGVAKYMVKDLVFAADVAAATGTNPALLPALKAAFEELTAAGLGDNDISVARRFVAER